MDEIKVSEDLLKLDNKCVNVNIEYLNYMYYIFITVCTFDETVYSVFNKYMKIDFKDEYVISYNRQFILMNPVELKLLVDYTNAEQYLSSFVKVTNKTLESLVELHVEIEEKFIIKRFRESGNVIKAKDVIISNKKRPITDSKDEQNLINDIVAANSNQSKVSDIITQAKKLTSNGK
jgi:hypothetical protein